VKLLDRPLVRQLLEDLERFGIQEQRRRVEELKGRLSGLDSFEARRLESLAAALVEKSVWIVGGDGWACARGTRAVRVMRVTRKGPVCRS